MLFVFMNIKIYIMTTKRYSKKIKRIPTGFEPTPEQRSGGRPLRPLSSLSRWHTTVTKKNIYKHINKNTIIFIYDFFSDPEYSQKRHAAVRARVQRNYAQVQFRIETSIILILKRQIKWMTDHHLFLPNIKLYSPKVYPNLPVQNVH